MKGAVGFLVGIIGVCVFGALAMLVPFAMRSQASVAVLLFVLVVAFIFFNVMIIGFYRILGSLHETVLYPDDAYYYPHRGRGLFFTGYIGLLVTIVAAVFLAVLPEWTNRRMGREFEVLFVLAWLTGWVFIGCLLGGVLMMLSDLYHKAFYRSAVNPPTRETDDDLNIARGAGRRPAAPPRRTWENE